MKDAPLSSIEDKKDAALKYDPRRLYSAPWVPIVFVMLTSAAIINNNSFPVFLIYFFILFLGVIAVLRLGAMRGGLVGMALLIIWTAVKLVDGAWLEQGFPLNLIEMVWAALTFVASALYHNQIKAFLSLFAENQRRMKNMDMEDKAIGLTKSTIGLARLREEEGRSTRYKRPFSMILIQVRPMPEIEWGPEDLAGLMRTLADTVKSKIRAVDIPFLVSPDQVGLLLPETEVNGARKVVNNIIHAMMDVQFVPQSGAATFMWKYAQIRFGFSVFLGISNKRIDMLEAARRSLERNLKTNPGDLYQNVFIEWETVGEPLQTSPAPESAPVEMVVPLDAPTLAAPSEKEKKSAIVRLIERLRSI